ncbi:MAG: hypothetical protein C5B54_07295 [Acidobacteria bacterium]|nr:MAG: hypothetical protein C5B54_07295 [Acidobacteriota bacterium]
MPGKANPWVLDNGLIELVDDATHIYICASEPADYAAVLTTQLGNKDFSAAGGVFVTATNPSNRTPNGRRVTTQAVTDGSVTANGTAAWWAIVDAPNTRLLLDNALAASQGVTSGNVFSLPPFDFGIPSVGA